ncbi:MAG: ABC transporter permease [Rickettsiales bacterium]|jgi:phospholipid/cholesterol/gamma-HCH transport system permease protein|nr:ABC transporter permease [Rickettsiales bacterium]
MLRDICQKSKNARGYFNIIGKHFLKVSKDIAVGIGSFSLFFGNCIRSLVLGKRYPQKIKEQFMDIGFKSLLLVAITAIFTGGVLALQTYAGCSRFGIETTVPSVVIISLTRELGPILVGLMVAGRISTSVAAELATMKVTEQLDALQILSTSPFDFLIVPKIIACTLSLPILVLIADIIGLLGGTVASIFALNFELHQYLLKSFEFLDYSDVVSGLAKSFVFGFIISICGCYYGFNARGGAEGVGRATISAIVKSSMFILLTNYFMTQLFFI